MPLSNVQHGVIAQNEFAKYLMMGSGGRIELAAPLTDEERRDFEIHVHGQYGSGLAVQVKSTLALPRLGARARYLRTFFVVRAGRVINHPLYWYFFAYLDPKLMRFAKPTFLVPSTDLHKQANPSRNGAFWHFSFEASMEPDSRDRWREYRVDPLELGKRVLEVIRDLKRGPRLSLSATEIPSTPGVVWARLTK